MTNAFVAYSDNYLIDTDHGVLVDVESDPLNPTSRGRVDQDDAEPR